MHNNKICENCGVSFSKGKRRRDQWERQKFCSRTCSNEFTCIKKGSKPWNTGIKMTEEQKSNLNLDGLEIGRQMSRDGKIINLSGENHPGWKTKTHKHCETCQKEMFLSPNEQDKRFCSHKCYTEWNRGINNPRFLGDKALGTLRRRIMELPEYKKWRLDIMKKDNFRCQICQRQNPKDSYLTVDHIKRMCTILRENNIHTPEEARNCPELWDINNGRVLCWNCHRKTQTYGTKGLKNHKTHY